MKNRNVQKLVVLLVVALLAVQAQAAVNLHFTPMDTTVELSATGRLAVMIDNLDANVRTIDLYVTYDTSVVSSLSGGAGAAFIDSGFFLFKGFENDIPGQWHGYCVIMGSTDFLEGPGELFYWDYQGLAIGTTPIIAVEAYVAAGDGVYYPDVILDSTTITVYDPTSPVADVPLAQPVLKAWPNPFNPQTSISIDLPNPGYAHVAVYDLRGRELAVLQDGEVAAGSQVYVWDGRDSQGMTQPAGQYLVRMMTADVVRTTKLMMVK
jgi:hypothetical protein